MKSKNFIIIGLCSIIALFSCEKDNDENIGAQLTDDPNKISSIVKDDFVITTYSTLEDSVTTSGVQYNLVGGFKSEETGLAKSCLFVSFAPDTLDRIFPESNFYIDRFDLKLNINQVYGTPNNEEFEVYLMQEHLTDDTTYYNFDSIPLGDKIGTFIINSSDTGDFTFSLDSAEASRLMSTDVTTYSNYENFGEIFPGICIKPKTSSLSSNEGAIFKITSESLAIDFSFKTTNGKDDDFDTEIVYNTPSSDFVFSQFVHDFSGSELENLVNDSTVGQNSFILQGMAASFGKIEFPNVEEWYNSDTANYLINSFIIQLPAESGNFYELPDSLVISYKISADESRQQFLDLDESTNSYAVEIPASFITETLSQGFFNQMEFSLFVPFQRENPQVLELFGSDGLIPPKLQITSTKF